MATKSLKQQLADAEKLEKEQSKKAQLLRDKIKKEEESKKPKSILDSIKNFDDILKIAKKKGYKYKPSKDDSKDEAAEKKIKLACLVVSKPPLLFHVTSQQFSQIFSNVFIILFI